MWPLERFWNNFLQDGALWKNMVVKAYRSSLFTVSHVLIPLWFVHYYVKYHTASKPYAIVGTKPKIFPGDTILETGEVIPPMRDFPDKHH